MVQGLQISARAGSSALTSGQKRFNTLIRQIDQARRTLAAWQEQVPLYAQAYTQLIVPLAKELAAEQRLWAFGLDRLLVQPGWTKAERDTLRELLCDATAELLSEGDEPDAALKALFDKHAEVDFDTEQQQSRLALKDMVETMTGMDLGDDDIASDEELFKRMHKGVADDLAAAQAQEPPRRSRQNKAQQRRETEAQLATQSVREVFRKLASALHPDRETDASARQAKTALMQKANQAYASNDLLTLLELQLQVEQVDAGHIASASASAPRIRHYNKVLAEQLDELKAEIDRVEVGFRMDFGLEPGFGLNPKKLFGSLDVQAKDMRAGLALRRQELRKLDDRVGMKRWLKRQRQRLREPFFSDDFF